MKNSLPLVVTVAFSLVGVAGDYLLKLASEQKAPLRSGWFYLGFAVYASTAFGWVYDAPLFLLFLVETAVDGVGVYLPPGSMKRMYWSMVPDRLELNEMRLPLASGMASGIAQNRSVDDPRPAPRE